MPKTAHINYKMRESDTSILKDWLKERDPNDEPGEKSILGFIIREEYYKNFKVMMDDKRTNVNEKNPIGTSILTRIILSGQMEMFLRILKRKDLDINAENKRGMSALDYAITQGNKIYVKKLIEAGAEIKDDMYQYAKGDIKNILQQKKVGKFARLLR